MYERFTVPKTVNKVMTMEPTGLSIYPYEETQLTCEEVRVIVAEAHVWQKRADLRWVDLRKTNLIGADLRDKSHRLSNSISIVSSVDGR